LTGQSVSREELTARLEPYRGGRGLEDGQEVPLGLYLQVTPPREIIARMLRNLKEIHKTQADWQRLVAVQDRLLVLLPQAWDEYRDRGLAHAELGQARQSVRDLETYLIQTRNRHDRQYVSERLAQLRRALD